MSKIKEIKKIHEIKIQYNKKKEQIKKRLNDFKRYYNENVYWSFNEDKKKKHFEIFLIEEKAKTDEKDIEIEKNSKNNKRIYNLNKDNINKKNKLKKNKRLFEELCFCVLTANGTAITGIKAIYNIRNNLLNYDEKKIQTILKKNGIRFHNRASYIIENLTKLKKDFNFDIENIIENKKQNKKELRDFFVSYVKGFGYKEASHFLRNIGFFNYTILDKHILYFMKEIGIISEIPKTLTKKKYLKLEQKLIEFSKKINIDINELDLLLWSMKTGKILK